jgi:hypothetical protein
MLYAANVAAQLLDPEGLGQPTFKLADVIDKPENTLIKKAFSGERSEAFLDKDGNIITANP